MGAKSTTARKAHVCEQCSGLILRGEKYTALTNESGTIKIKRFHSGECYQQHLYNTRVEVR